jgi:hypothetical protein
MKKRESAVRRKMIVVRLNESEYDRLQTHLARTTEKTVAQYVRKLLLHQPVQVKYRNVSVDDFLRDVLELKRELIRSCEVYSKGVEKLQLLHHIPEFRYWLTHYEEGRITLLRQVEAIDHRMNLLYNLWLQK